MTFSSLDFKIERPFQCAVKIDFRFIGTKRPKAIVCEVERDDPVSAGSLDLVDQQVWFRILSIDGIPDHFDSRVIWGVRKLDDTIENLFLGKDGCPLAP